jgi:transcriptional regulator with XRE-family HTH domain
MTFAEKLRRLIDDGCLKATRISERAGLGKNAIASYLAKRCIPRGDIALRIARAFRVNVAWLLDDSQGWPPVRVETEIAAVQDAA